MSKKYSLAAIALGCLIAVQVHAASIIGPSPYLSIADTPSEFTNAGMGMPFMIQDFESPDGPWEMGFTIDVGKRIGPKFISGAGVPVTDSVDADDESIDGDGTMGSSWFIPSAGATITFDTAVKTAGFVLTDADNRATELTIEVLDENGNQLIQQTFDRFWDDVFTGTTPEDRFFGIIPMSASERIKQIKIGIDVGSGIEIDHIQKYQVPEPAAGLLMLISLLGLSALRRPR